MAVRRLTAEQGSASTSFTVGEWQVEPLLSTITTDGRRLRLERKPMQVLSRLALAAPGPVTRPDLRSAVWPDVYASDQALTRCIVALRRAFGDSASRPRYLQTIPKVGYRIIAPVTFVDRESAWAAAFPESRGRCIEEQADDLRRELGAFLTRCRDHVYFYTPDCRFVGANEPGAEALGKAPHQLVGKHWTELNLPEDAMLPMERLVRCCYAKNVTQVGRVSHVSIFGDQEFEYVVTPLSTGRGGDAAVLAVVRAITGRKAPETDSSGTDA